jgi:uncharacterized membrane protein
MMSASASGPALPGRSSRPDRSGRSARSLELAYRIGLAVKAFDGVVELLAGLILWLTPSMLHTLLTPLAQTDADDRALHVQVARWVGRLDGQLAAGPNQIVILFLLLHGVVKIVLVYCLLKEYQWVYPWALALLALFAAYQGYVFVLTPSLGLAILLVLDIAIIALVWREWRVLRTKTATPPAS